MTLFFTIVGDKKIPLKRADWLLLRKVRDNHGLFDSKLTSAERTRMQRLRRSDFVAGDHRLWCWYLTKHAIAAFESVGERTS